MPIKRKVLRYSQKESPNFALGKSNGSSSSLFLCSCKNFVTNNTTNTTSPNVGCCNSLRLLAGNGTDCLCLIVIGSVPFQLPINRTLAISLPCVYNMPRVPPQCNGLGPLQHHDMEIDSLTISLYSSSNPDHRRPVWPPIPTPHIVASTSPVVSASKDHVIASTSPIFWISDKEKERGRRTIGLSKSRI
ncbi:uncharacterized protein LOC131166671 [Malania oleifera]|uniref:uncharacterized protein LOC131166671 n=1 Tax=Malania oleifera TaxID=397392 RepID=UPI0025ADEA3A|nr:uncharacterized protein LOC131166671 [Malania oleifera]